MNLSFLRPVLLVPLLLLAAHAAGPRDGFHAVNFPPSRLTLKIPQEGLTAHAARAGGGTASPTYFSFSGGPSGLMVSGWFEPAARFSNLEKFWKGETDAWKRAGQPTPENVRFEKLNGWDVIAYDIALAKVANTHLRAELVRDGTWIDVHLSLTAADRPVAEVRAELLAFFKRIAVESR